MSHLRAVVSWSSGKDAAFALHLARLDGEVEIAGLLSSINAEFQRVSMHGVRRELLEQQARAAGLPLHIVELPWPCPNEEYERRMAAVCQHLREQGIEAVIFGDIHLADVRDYREKQMARAGLKPLFPLWGRDSRQLLEEMLAAGIRARVVCLDPRRLSSAFAGAELSPALLPSLPEGVDPCGENGEFHTFVTHAPVFSAPVEVTPGRVIERDGFLYADLLPASGAVPADA